MMNYRQAIDNVNDLSKALKTAKKNLRIPSDEVFEEWKAEEAAFLVIPSKVNTPYEVTAMEYVKRIQEHGSAM